LNYTPEELYALGIVLGDDVTVHRSVQFFGGEYLRIGSHVRIDCFAVISAGDAGVTIGNHVHIATYVALFGASARVTLGDFCGLSARTTLFTASDDFTGATLTGPTVPPQMRNVTAGPVTVGRHVIVGAGTVILPNVTLGEGAAVGAMSLVRTDVEPFAIVAGNPLRRIGTRERRMLELEQQLGS